MMQWELWNKSCKAQFSNLKCDFAEERDAGVWQQESPSLESFLEVIAGGVHHVEVVALPQQD